MLVLASHLVGAFVGKAYTKKLEPYEEVSVQVLWVMKGQDPRRWGDFPVWMRTSYIYPLVEL